MAQEVEDWSVVISESVQNLNKQLKEAVASIDLPKGTWYPKDEDYPFYNGHLEPVVAGVVDGALDELKSIPQLINVVTDFATDQEARNQMIAAFEDLDIEQVLDDWIAKKEEIYSGTDTALCDHEAGKDGVAATVLVATAGVSSVKTIKKGVDYVKDLAGNIKRFNGAGDWIAFIGKNIDELAEAPLGYQFYTRNEQKFIRRLDASNLNTPQFTVRDSKIVQVTGTILSNAEEIKLLLKTDVDKAFFWSGRTSHGVGVMDVALEIAQSKGGTTLEGILEKYKIVMPEWNSNKPSVVQLWEDVSALYANQVSGEVRAVLGRNLRSGNIWETVELPRLKQNPNVTKIYTIDPETKIEILLWKR